MSDKAHRTPFAPKNKGTTKTTTKRGRQKTPAMLAKLIALGIPKAMAETFPLTPHDRANQWCKKLPTPQGPKMCYFGSLPNWQAALDRYNSEKEGIVRGAVPSKSRRDDGTGGLRLHELLNTFIETKLKKLSNVAAASLLNRRLPGGQDMPDHWAQMLTEIAESKKKINGLSRFTWIEYFAICSELKKEFGRDRLVMDIGPADFENLLHRWSLTWSVARQHSEINRTRVVFNFAWKNGLIPRPILFGEGFRRPSKKDIKLDREERGSKVFSVQEVREAIRVAGCRRVLLDDGTRKEIPEPGMQIKAMVLLAINCGLGNNDVGLLRMKHLDLDAGWLRYPRPKTGVRRRCPLWKETVDAIREWLPNRPTPADPGDIDLVFVTTRDRRGWTADIKARPLTNEMRKLLDWIGAKGKSFYGLRHTFETIGGNSCDQVAVDLIMGHADDSIAANYRDDDLIDDRRLRAVVDHVHRWLFAEPAHCKKPLLKVVADDGGETKTSVA